MHQTDPVGSARPDQQITFRGRGRATLSSRRLILSVCPICSQRNAAAAAQQGHCAWCAYVPSLDDAEPVLCNAA